MMGSKDRFSALRDLSSLAGSTLGPLGDGVMKSHPTGAVFVTHAWSEYAGEAAGALGADSHYHGQGEGWVEREREREKKKEKKKRSLERLGLFGLLGLLGLLGFLVCVFLLLILFSVFYYYYYFRRSLFFNLV